MKFCLYRTPLTLTAPLYNAYTRYVYWVHAYEIECHSSQGFTVLVFNFITKGKSIHRYEKYNFIFTPLFPNLSPNRTDFEPYRFRTVPVLNHITLDSTLSRTWYGIIRVHSSTIRVRNPYGSVRVWRQVRGKRYT